MVKIRLAEGSGKKPVADAMAKYYTPKPVGDYDLVALVAMGLKEKGMEDGAKAFLTDPSIIVLKDTPSDIQRFIINKYFKFLLFRFVSRSKKTILPVLPEFFNDGDHSTWLQRFYNRVCPYLKFNNVFAVMK